MLHLYPSCRIVATLEEISVMGRYTVLYIIHHSSSTVHCTTVTGSPSKVKEVVLEDVHQFVVEYDTDNKRSSKIT
jgi:hypothetical protein